MLGHLLTFLLLTKRRDVAASVSPASVHLQIAKNHPFDLQLTKTPEIRSWAIMRLFKCKIN